MRHCRHGDFKRDVEFARPDGQALQLDIYQPRSSIQRESQANLTTASLLPGIIVIHGGLWRSGTKRDFARYDRWLAESGRVVFDIEYRLAHITQQFPAQLITSAPIHASVGSASGSVSACEFSYYRASIFNA